MPEPPRKPALRQPLRPEGKKRREIDARESWWADAPRQDFAEYVARQFGRMGKSPFAQPVEGRWGGVREG